MTIRTPDQRVRVFVSSTLEELAEERQAVRDAIGSLRMTPVMFEQGARPHPPRALYRAYLEQSDVFVGLYWKRYGWVAPGEEISGLEDEYARSGDRPKLIYIKSPATNREPRLSQLIERIQLDDRVSFRRFSLADELRSLVADDLAVMLSESFASEPRTSFGSLSPLPRPPTRLIGREEDIERLLELLSDPNIRLVTIFGTGGIGKSRVALAVAEKASSRYADGVAYLDLAAVSEPSLLIPSIATALGVQERAGASVALQLRERLSGSRTLIVLDNMEQLRDAAADVSELLAGTGAVQFLVTSRRILDIRSERVYELEPLAVPAIDGAVTPAVELFLDRAHAIVPEFSPKNDDLGAIGEICRRLDGLPLAIELASARLRTLPPHALVDRMGHHRLDLLRTGPRDLPARQRTLRDTIAWSHSLLSSEAQMLFARLGVFVGSADLEAIELVANPDRRFDALDVLAELVDESLIRVTGETEPRFGMLGTIREFAVERLDASGEAGDCLARHEAYYLQLAERGTAALSTADQLEWLGRFGRENDNFRAILRRAIRRDNAAAALRMGRALATFWYMRAGYSEGRGWMDQIAVLPSAGPRERAIAWTIGAIQAFLLGDRDPLRSGLDDAIRLAQDEDRRIVAFARLLRAIARGAEPDDQELGEATHQLATEGEPLAIALGLVASASLAHVHGQLQKAQRLAQKAHDLSTQFGDWWVRAYASGQLSIAALKLGDRKGARRHAVDSLVAAQRLGNLSAVGDALGLWAMAELGDSRIEQAGRLFALAERGYQQLGHGQWRPDAASYEQLSSELRAALGDRYEPVLAEARDTNLDDAIADLISSAAGTDDTPSITRAASGAGQRRESSH